MANARLICGPFPGLALPSKGSLIFVIIVYALTIGRAWPSAAPCRAGDMHVQCARRPCTTLAQALPRPLPVGRDRCGPRHGGRKSFAGPPVCSWTKPYILLTKRPYRGCGPTPAGWFCRATVALLLALRAIRHLLRILLWATLSAGARKTPVHAWAANKWLLLLLVAHWALLVGVMSVGNPATHVSNGVHQPVRRRPLWPALARPRRPSDGSADRSALRRIPLSLLPSGQGCTHSGDRRLSVWHRYCSSVATEYRSPCQSQRLTP